VYRPILINLLAPIRARGDRDCLFLAGSALGAV